MAGDNRAAGLTGRGLRQAPAPCRRRLRRTARARTRSSRAGTPRARNQGRIAGPWAGTPRFPAAPGHGLEYLRNCLLRTRTEIEYSILAAVEDAQAGVDDVVEMDVVARPHAVAAYGRRLAVERGAGERGDDAAPARRVHAGPVDVAETQDRVPDAGRCAHRGDEELGSRLGRAVRRDRGRRLALRRRERRRIAVERPARGSEDEPAHAVLRALPQHAYGAAHVDCRAAFRCAHRFGDARHRGQVHHGLGRSRAERRIEIPRRDIRQVQGHARAQPLRLAGRAVVNDRHAVAGRGEPPGQRGADEPGAAGDHDIHAGRLWRRLAGWRRSTGAAEASVPRHRQASSTDGRVFPGIADPCGRREFPGPGKRRGSVGKARRDRNATHDRCRPARPRHLQVRPVVRLRNNSGRPPESERHVGGAAATATDGGCRRRAP